MSLSAFEGIILSIISIAFGAIGNITGGGGGTFVVPVMVELFDKPINVLLGAVFFMYVTGAISGFVVYARKGLVDYRSGIILALPCIPGVVIGTLLETSISKIEFKIMLGIVTIALSVLVLVRRNQTVGLNPGQSNTAGSSRVSKIVDQSGRVFEYKPNLVAGVIINLGAALLSGMFGAGAALVIVPATVLFVKMPSHVAIATTRIILVVLNASAVIAHVSIGAIDWLYAAILAVGALIGSMIGARIAFKLSPGLLTRVIAIFLILLGAYLIISA
ncbi:MAG: sulfite exporter TauE/SafE family protein [Thaumarchaeota archaeon]|nr:sulfite exporter TauE/SafE family protein [Nitrososphaerota archaeon]MDG6906376.1 sulfite exporter TauE/SafE family protein [Nitrososphaerota archaeon]